MKASTAKPGTLEHKLIFGCGLPIGEHGATLVNAEGKKISVAVRLGRIGSYPRIIKHHAGRLLVYQVRGNDLVVEGSHSRSTSTGEKLALLIENPTYQIQLTAP